MGLRVGDKLFEQVFGSQSVWSTRKKKTKDDKAEEVLNHLIEYRREVGALVVVAAIFGAGFALTRSVAAAEVITALLGLTVLLLRWKQLRRYFLGSHSRRRFHYALRHVRMTGFPMGLVGTTMAHVWVVGIKHSDIGMTLRVRLRRGTSANQLHEKQSALASTMATRWLTIREPLRIAVDPNNAMYCSVEVRLRDGLQRDMGDWPVFKELTPQRKTAGRAVVETTGRPVKTTAFYNVDSGTPVNFRDPLPIGYDEHRRMVHLSMIGRHLLIGGETGAGKSVAATLVCAYAALDPHTTIYLMDANKIQFNRWSACAKRFVCSSIEASKLLDDLLCEIERRNQIIADLGLDQWIDVKGLHPVLLMVDEGAKFLYDKTTRDRLTDVVARSRASGVSATLITQSPNASVMTTPLRNNFGIRMAFRTTDSSASDIILGSGHAKLGADASRISPKDRGVCYLHQDGELPIRMRTIYLKPEQVKHIAQVAEQRRYNNKEK